MATAFKAAKTNVAVSTVTPKTANWGTATAVASATSLENIKSIRGSLTVTHKTTGWTYKQPDTLLAIVVDAWIAGSWQTIYTTAVEGAPALAFPNVGLVGAPIASRGDGSADAVQIPTLNLNGQTATGKRLRYLVFGPATASFDVEGELHGYPTAT